MRALGWLLVLGAGVWLWQGGHLDPAWSFVQAIAGWVADR